MDINPPRPIMFTVKEVQRRLGQRVRLLRLKKGLTQEALSFASGLDRSFVGQVERGESNVSLVNIKRLADALGVTVSVLTKGI